MRIKLSKGLALVIVAITLFIGSIVTFYAGNLVCSDISNMFYGAHDIYFFSSIPLFILSFVFVVIVLFVIRLYRYPEKQKKMIKLYTLILYIICAFTIISSLFAGIVVYGNLFAPYPFSGYFVVMIIVSLIIIALCIVVNCLVNKHITDDEVFKKLKHRYIINTVVLVVIIFLAMYRFGSSLWAITYAQARTLYLTIPFYVWASIPMAVVLHIVMYFLNIYKKYSHSIIYVAIVLGLHLLLGIVVYILEYNSPIFISAISPALPLERLANDPLDTNINFIGMAIIGAYYLFYAVRSYIREKKKEA